MRRFNPLHYNTCSNRFAMYRDGQCVDGEKICVFLSECDRHWDEKTGEFDYPKPEFQYNRSVKLIPKEGGMYDTEIAGIPFTN